MRFSSAGNEIARLNVWTFFISLHVLYVNLCLRFIQRHLTITLCLETILHRLTYVCKAGLASRIWVFDARLARRKPGAAVALLHLCLPRVQDVAC